MLIPVAIWCIPGIEWFKGGRNSVLNRLPLAGATRVVNLCGLWTLQGDGLNERVEVGRSQGADEWD